MVADTKATDKAKDGCCNYVDDGSIVGLNHSVNIYKQLTNDSVCIVSGVRLQSLNTLLTDKDLTRQNPFQNASLCSYIDMQ